MTRGLLPTCVCVVSLVAVMSGCTASRPPVFEPVRSIGPSVMVLPPEVRLGPTTSESIRAGLVDQLTFEVRRALAGDRLDVGMAATGEHVTQLRSALLESLWRARSTGRGRMRPGTDLGLGGLLAASAGSAQAVILPVLSRGGLSYGEDTYVPRAPDEIVPRPEDRPDYEIPKAGREAFGVGVDFDMVVVDVATSQVIAHRHVSHPAANSQEISESLPVLVREAARNLSRR